MERKLLIAACLPLTVATAGAGDNNRIDCRPVVDDGGFFAPFLTPGIYDLAVGLQGFTTAKRSGTKVRLGQRVDRTVLLSVGPTTETLDVAGRTSHRRVIDHDGDRARQGHAAIAAGRSAFQRNRVRSVHGRCGQRGHQEWRERRLNGLDVVELLDSVLIKVSFGCTSKDCQCGRDAPHS